MPDESVEAAINATEGSVTDTLQEALANAEAEDWRHVMVIGLRGDDVLVRIVSLSMPFHTRIGMTAWANAIDREMALDVDYVQKDL